MIKYIIASFAGIVVLSGCTATDTAMTESETMKGDQKVVNTAQDVAPDDHLHSHDLLAAIPAGELTELEKRGLILMREEEKLARDVYQTLYAKWGQRIFSNIAASEQTHTDTVKYLIDRYELDDPVKDDTIGVFTNAEMQKLYDELVAEGNKSLIAALTVGATIEDLDMKDLQALLQETESEDIRIAYDNLLRGSRNHMRAFNRQLEKNGATYEARYLSQEEIDEILAGEQESGGEGHGGGQGRGGGQGMYR